MNNKRYDELYKEDLKKIEKILNEKSIFAFTYDQTNDYVFRYNGANLDETEHIMINNYHVDHYIQDYANTTLNPRLLEKEAIKIIKDKMENVYESRRGNFHTNIGIINAKYCYIRDDEIYFYGLTSNNLIAKFKKNGLEYITDDKDYIYKR